MDEDVLEQLTDPGIYPDHPASVEVLQTHISVVCIAGDLVYKLKKPVKLPFLDFSTPELREHICREEVRLNRRLCPTVYLGVAELFANDDGSVSFVGPGTVVEHAVQMRRLPQDRMMDVLLASDRVEEAAVRQLAKQMFRFHEAHRVRPGIDDPGRPEYLAKLATENFTETTHLAGDLFDPDLHRALARRTEKDMAIILPAMQRRAERGLVVDGHGDLHARNICLTDPPAVYDCLEFSAAFRMGDVATENAFLVMDLIYRGHPELAHAYVDTYSEAADDAAQQALMPTLIGYRAMVRAKVSALASLDTAIPEDDRSDARASAVRHLRLVATSAVAQDGPTFLLACGLPASGKSFVFEKLAAATGWRVVSSDLVRKELAGVPPDEPAPEESYSPQAVSRTYAEVFDRASGLVDRGLGPVLLDATFQSKDRRIEVAKLAAARGIRTLVVHFDVSDAEARRRLDARAGRTVSDADVKVYEEMSRSFDPPDEGEQRLRVNADLSAETIVDQTLAWLVSLGRTSAR